MTIYVLSDWIQTRFPKSDPFTHNAGHLWHTLFGLKGDPHFDVFHIVSYIRFGAGFWTLSAAWDVLHRAQQHHELATTGIYARLRHPQYVAFVMIMLGFLFQWPTLLTLLMFPILVILYTRLAASEEREMRATFGAPYIAYAAKTPRFVPRIFGSGSAHAHS